LATSGCSTSGVPASGPESRHDIHDARRKARFLDELHEFEQGSRRVFTGLQHHDVARRECGCQFPRGQEQRRIPRNDRADDAERFEARVVERVGLVDRDDLTFDLVGEPAVVVVPLRHVGGLRAHFGVELAVVAHFDFRERFRFVGDQVAELAQQRAAPGGGHLRPFTRSECFACRAHCAIDIFRIAARHQRPWLAGERVKAFEMLAGSGVDPLAINVHPEFDERSCGGIHGVIRKE
jgi:hypothetical protein